MRRAAWLTVWMCGCAAAPAVVEETEQTSELTQSDIRRAIQQHLPALQDCSNRFQRLRPGKHGKLLVQFHVLQSGETGDVSARGENAPQELGACVTEVFRVMRFKRHRSDPELVLWPMKY